MGDLDRTEWAGGPVSGLLRGWEGREVALVISVECEGGVTQLKPRMPLRSEDWHQRPQASRAKCRRSLSQRLG